ncbi:MAG: hypothetical protein H0U82_05030 [Actinobacteria bacterium]|nr:hypothetical protein [Actinomycetota bacterium]
MAARHLRRLRLASLGTGVVVSLLGVLVLAMLPGLSGAAVAVAPQNTGEPQITGTPRVGEVQRASRGTWTGTQPITYMYRWFRCDGRGAADASDCGSIANARNATYVARQADAGFRLRLQVSGTNADGSDTATSNPTPIITSARPTNTTEPAISGTAEVGNRLTANRGTWVGEQPITYAFRWLRCAADGDNCSEISGATDNEYVVQAADSGRSLRVRVTATNDAGSRSAISNPRVVGQQQPPPPPPPPPPSGNSVAAGDLKAGGDRLVVSQVRFSPNPVTSRTAPITARVRITDQRGRAVRGALVFMRATPRVVRGDRQATAGDGWVTIQLVPNSFFPEPRNNFNVQFFIKAYRASDPPLGGIAGYRLVQVRLAG